MEIMKMKKVLIVLLLLISITILNANNLIYKTLPNGMEVAVKENRNNSSVGIYCFVKTGSVNEGKYLGAGISHFLEHVVSGGSTSIGTEAEYQELGKEMGAIVNAYTNKTATVFYIITDKEYQDDALQILSEQMQFCAFDSTEVAREKQVILKEIVMRSTPPLSKMYQKQNELIYPNSNSKYPIIGYTELFKTITREELEEYYHKRYCPNNMVFVIVGDINAEETMSKIEKTFINFKRKQLEPVYLPTQNIRIGNFEFIEEFEIEQPTVMMTTILPAADYADDQALNAAMDILFSKRKSPITYKLVEELQLVNYVYGYALASMNSTEGIIEILFEAKDVKDVKRIVSIIDEEIEAYSKSGFNQEDIQNLITRRKAWRLLSTPGVESECNRIGWNIMRYGVPDAYEVIQEKYGKLEVKDLENVLKKHLLPKNRVVFYAVPAGTKQFLEEKETVTVEKSEPTKIIVSKDITLIHKFNNEKPFVKGVIFLPIETSYETKNNVGSISFMTRLMFKGTRNFDPMYLSEWKEDHVVSFNAYSNKNGTYIEFKCLKEDYSKLQEIIIDAVKNPTFNKNEIELAKERKKGNYKRDLSDADYLHDEFRNHVLYGDTRDGISNEERLNIICALTQNDLFNLYKKYFNTESAIFTYFGDISAEEAESLAKEIFKNIPKSKINEEKFYSEVPDINENFINQYGFEQVNIDLNYPAPKLLDEDFFIMRVIESILNGSRGRIHNAVRGENDLAYYAFPYYRFDKKSGFFRLHSQTSIDKKEDLINVLENEIEKLRNEIVSREEIGSAIEERQKILNSYLNDNKLPYYMTYYESISLGYDYISNSSEILKHVTPEDIIRVANKYFKNVAIIVSEPSKDVELMVE